MTVFGKSEDILAMSSDMNLLEFSDEKDASNDPRAVFAVRKQSLTDQSLTEGTLKKKILCMIPLVSWTYAFNIL